MVLSGQHIQHAVASGLLKIAPFDRALVNPVSYDLRLDGILVSPSGERVRLGPAGRTLRKGEFWIGQSIEHVAFPGGQHFATLHNKSGTARQGATAHLTANVIQPDHNGRVLFFIEVAEDVHVMPGMKYAQLKPMALEDFVAGPALVSAIARGDIEIAPFHPDQVHGASYRLRLAPTLSTVDGRVVSIPPEGLVVRKGEFWLGESVERLSFGRPGVMASLHNKAATAANGTTAHMCAGIIQPDHQGPIQFHIRPTQDCLLRPNMVFAQLTFPRALDREHIAAGAELVGGVVLDRSAIRAALAAGTITLDPCPPELGARSSAAHDHLIGIDYHLGHELKACVGTDAQGKQIFAPVAFPEHGGVELLPGVLYLGHTMEEIGSTSYAMALHGLESMAALSLEPQIDADLGHTGVRHRWTLEIRCVERVSITPGMRIGQVLFEAVRGPVIQYDGRHARFSGAQESLSRLVR